MQNIPSITLNPRHALLSVQTRLDQISRNRLGLRVNEEDPYLWLLGGRATLPRTAFYWLLIGSAATGALLCLIIATGAFLQQSHTRFVLFMLTATLLSAATYLCWHWWKQPERVDQAIIAWLEAHSASLARQYLNGYITPTEATEQILNSIFAPTDAIWTRILLGRSRYSAFTLIPSVPIPIPLSLPYRSYFYDLSQTQYLLRLEVPFGQTFTLTAWYQVPKEASKQITI
jgi:hypothetical protein